MIKEKSIGRFVVAEDETQEHASNVIISQVFPGDDIVGKKVLVTPFVTTELTLQSSAARVYASIEGSLDGVNFAEIAAPTGYIASSSNTKLNVDAHAPILVDLTGLNIPFIRVKWFATQSDGSTARNITAGKLITRICY